VARPVLREHLAELDLNDHVDYIAADNPTAAARFIDAVEKAFRLLSLMPEIGPQRHFRSPRLAGVRFWPIPGFETYLIFYRVVDQAVQVR
jgi:toxin ParE1/3/4